MVFNPLFSKKTYILYDNIINIMCRKPPLISRAAFLKGNFYGISEETVIYFRLQQVLHQSEVFYIGLIKQHKNNTLYGIDLYILLYYNIDINSICDLYKIKVCQTGG